MMAFQSGTSVKLTANINQEFRKAIMCGPANSIGYSGGHGILGSADNTGRGSFFF